MEKKPRKSALTNNGIYPTHVGVEHEIPGVKLPRQKVLVGEGWRRKLNLGGSNRLGDDDPYDPPTLHSRRECKDKVRQMSKMQARVKEFHRSLDGAMKDEWPPVEHPRITVNILEWMVLDWPLHLKTPGSPCYSPDTMLRRWPFLLDAKDFPLRNFQIHLILDLDRQHDLHFSTDFDLMNACTATALQAEADIYGQFSRPDGDITCSLMVVVRTRFNKWELMPLVLLRRRPVRILMDWIFTSARGYWSLPLRVEPFHTTETTVHPEYVATTLSEMLGRHPPCDLPLYEPQTEPMDGASVGD